MFVNIVEFPSIKEGKDKEFREWFAWSNSVFEKFDGFISRRLLKPTKGKGNYAAIVEHKSEETFMAMHMSEEREKVHEKVKSLFEGSPKPSFYEVIVSSEKKR
jgi:heme-degrading monooxygenase HmoA